MRHLTTCLLTVALCLACACAGAGEIRLGTATPGGGFELYGKHLVRTLRTCDAGLDISITPTRGSRQNLALLESGELELGLVEGNAARRALDGIGRDAADLKVLSVMYPNPGMFVVPADSPWFSIEDLEGEAVAFGTRASGLRILVNDVLAALGLDWQRDFTPVILDEAAAGPRKVLAGEVAALWGAGIGWPGFTEVADSARGARFIAPSPPGIERILARHPHLRPMSVPAGSYRGQDARIDSVGLWSLVLVRPALDEASVARLARALHRCETVFAEGLAQAAFSRLRNTLEEVAPERLHPGVLRYVREQGLPPPAHREPG